MGVIPILKSFRREDYPDESEGFYRLLTQLSPFCADVTSALSGGLDASNLGKQYAEMKLTTASTLEATFAPGKVVIKNKLKFRPRSITLGKCQPSTTPTYAQDVWQTPTLLNSWVAFDTGYQQPGYMLDGAGWVHLRGVIKNGSAANTTAWVMPAAYYPALDVVMGNASGTNAFGTSRVWSAGTASGSSPGGVHVSSYGSNAYFSFDGLKFPAASWVSTGPFGQPQWTLTSNGTVQINGVSGLSPLTQYDLAFVIE